MELAKDSLDIGLVVGGIEKTLTFYKDTLGLKYLGVNSIYDDLSSRGVEFLSKPIEIPGIKITIAMMLDPDGNHLELVSRG